jgi:hypothetical protein
MNMPRARYFEHEVFPRLVRVSILAWVFQAEPESWLFVLGLFKYHLNFVRLTKQRIPYLSDPSMLHFSFHTRIATVVVALV